ncbi:hypothetical protein OEZ86_001937 [Tetradesmus obliquus]|nr:hypothetical protein OEZ86_001937 [Tetradesmus obliquus]
MLQPSALRARDVTLQELLANIDVSAGGSGGVRVALPPVPPPNRSSGSNSSANKRPDDRGLPPVVVNIKLSDLFPPEPSGRRILLTDSSSSSSGDASSIASTPASAAGSSRHLTASLLQAAASPSRSASSSSTGLSAYMRSNPSVAPDLQELTGGRRNPSISDSSEASSVKLCTGSSVAEPAVTASSGSSLGLSEWARDRGSAQDVQDLKTAVGKQALAPSPRLRAEDVKLTDVGGR